MHLETEQDTKDVAETLARIGRTFATDSLDSPELMLWREEQRAIGGLMQESGESSRILGFESFVEVY